MIIDRITADKEISDIMGVQQFQKIFVDFNYTSIENNCNWCKQYNMSLDLVKRKYKCKHFKEKSIEKKKQDEQDEDYY